MLKRYRFVLFLLGVLLWSSACRRPVVDSANDAIPVELAPTQVTAVSPVTPFPTPDRQLYHPGLTRAEQAGLTDLTHAPTYTMELRIDPDAGVILGSQIIDYTNNTGKPIQDLYFHLLPNLLGGRITVSGVQVNGRFLNPLYEELNDSVMRLPLSASLPPGGRAMVEMDFVTAVPQEPGPNYGVFAQIDGVMALAHFYPMLAVHDATGWNTAPPAPDGDPTYAGAAFYLVDVTAPSDQVIVGSGVIITQNDDGQVQQQILAAGPARDFYLALSPDYLRQTTAVGETTINSYAPPRYASGAEQALTVAATALQFFSERFGPYPYTELDIVATPTLALGVEYPGVIAITQRSYDLRASLSDYLTTTVVHEVAHQWFYNLVGNDQLDEPWLDEALAQYATWLYLLEHADEAVAWSYLNSWNGRWQQVGSAETPIGLPVSAYPGAAYSAIIYGRGPLFLRELAGKMGENTFAEFLQAYTAQHKWGIATTESFHETAEIVCQCDLNELFQEWVYGKLEE